MPLAGSSSVTESRSWSLDGQHYIILNCLNPEICIQNMNNASYADQGTSKVEVCSQTYNVTDRQTGRWSDLKQYNPSPFNLGYDNVLVQQNIHWDC